jgi:CubicO group peptidase (beta-lactamase class C family)
MFRIANCLFLAVALAAPLRATAATHAEKIDALIRSYNELQQFNGSALVAEKGRVILRKGYGMANMEWRIPNAPDTRFRIASNTKQFTSLLIMQLVSEGRVGLDDKITKYLPTYRKDTGDKITVRNLLTHTSGIPEYGNNKPEWTEKGRDPHSVADLVMEYAAGDLEFEPGTQFRYTNSGYVLLGAIIEAVTSKAYEEVLQDRIFGPLGMKDSGYEHAETVIRNRAGGYRLTPDGYRNAPYLDMSNLYAAGAIYSTVDDLFKWDRALYTDKLLDEEHRKVMWTPVRNRYAFGEVVGKMKLHDGKTEVSFIAHDGATAGFHAVQLRMPDSQDLVLLLDNASNDKSVDQLGAGIIDILHGIQPPPPKQPLREELIKTMDASGVPAALARYRELKAREPQKWDFNEQVLNGLGYEALERREVDGAIDAFRLNVEEYPKAWNVYDSLADAYEVDGDREMALANYKKSLELNPRNSNGEEAVKRLQHPAGAADVPTLARYAGTYRLSSGGELVVIREADKLVLQTPGSQRADLVTDSATRFHRGDGRSSIDFASDGRSLVLHQDGSDVSGKRVK